jgi:hypothetical protein
MTTIRNISQTVQEREIIKTAPDIVVYLEGLPYLLNYFIDDPNAKTNYSIVNFNDFVTSFNVGYDTDALVPTASFGLQVPNYLKHLFQMPGGNNLIQTMMEVQVFAKGYYLANNGDTVYRRVWKGLVSHVGYTDNGKTVEISVQCYGTLHFLELMQINLNPAVQTAVSGPVGATVFASVFASKNPYLIIAAMFSYGFNTAGFQQTNLQQPAPFEKNDRYFTAVNTGYVAKWQSILNSLSKDVHIYGVAYKELKRLFGKPNTKLPDTKGDQSKNKLAASQTYLSTDTEPNQQADLYYDKIRSYLPDMTVTNLQLLNNKIVSRLEYIRQMIQVIQFEGYQDIDGKIIVKPPLYNLDVTNLGPRNQKTSPDGQGSGDPYSSASNPLTEIYEQTNPFVVNLSEILTENETEDQAAIRKTRVTCHGNINPGFQVPFDNTTLVTGEWIDIPKLQKFGLREEPTVMVPWIANDKIALSIHAVAETVRSNRGYRTYTVTIPLRPELKLGFPIYFPHKDFYGYIKSVNIAYQVGGSATMTVTCDAIRRRVLIPMQAKDQSGAIYTSYQSAGDLVYKWTKDKAVNTQTSPNPNQSPGNNLQYLQNLYAQTSSGNTSTGSQSQNSPAVPTNKPATIPTTTDVMPSPHDNILQTLTSQRLASSWYMQADTTGGSYVSVPDNSSKDGTQDSKHPNGYYTIAGWNARGNVVDNKYFHDVWESKNNGEGSVIPYTDAKGYEVLAPFPWGRYKDLRTTIKEFTQDGYITQPTDVNGNPTTSQQDISVLNTVNSFLFAGLGTPTATQHPSDLLINALAQVQNETDVDTVIVLDYSSGQTNNDKQLLQQIQPDIAAQALKLLTTQTQEAGNQLIDVLVTGAVSPVKNYRQVMENLNAPPKQPANQPTPGMTAAQFANQPPTIDPGQGTTNTQNSTELDQFKGN